DYFCCSYRSGSTHDVF
nr:immunoglobulin light chain junction region [Macaca mulatta]MOW36161.1 immunoglobulin light chain junction region [Macaca mulatta]MOW36240.1 immunoglobulin light chain junction region [Macaca mulatta]MOW36274.1 immunoglobulin light chain junction region [Macaca mulatta]MOW36377.1 immunoglobulin light chain junction region [Macaca mulatta]